MVLDSLRKCFAQTGRKNWVQLLPLALWTANDIPGPVSGYSPDFVVLGRQPIGFGDCPPVIPEHGSQDAIQFFQRLVADRKYVQQKLQDIHDRESRKFLQQHPRHVYQDGERVWYQNHKKNSNKRKLDRLWQGPGEVLGRVGTNQYLVATEKGEVVLNSMRIEPYIPPSSGEQVPLHYYTEQEFLVETDQYIVEDIRGHKTSGRGKNKEILWEVKYRGFPETEWQPPSAFMNNVTDVWLKYNRKHNIDISIKDLRVLRAQDTCPCMLHDTLHQLYREERAARRLLKRLERDSRPE